MANRQVLNPSTSGRLQKKEAVTQRCSAKKGFLRNFTKFIGKHLCQSLFFNKVAGICISHLL